MPQAVRGDAPAAGGTDSLRPGRRVLEYIGDTRLRSGQHLGSSSLVLAGEAVRRPGNHAKA